ncbi:MFS transporter [Lentilactobacillus kribbianus]|uniref:MFS transporter n=1 Tax=Lentilactobacillus kribbianus TaxID=2729622 RepID=UPI001555FFF5
MIKERTEIRFSSVLIYSLLLNAGAAFMWPLVTVYMHDYLGKSMSLAGIVLFLMSMMMVLGSYVAGVLFDKWSPYKTAVLSILTSTIGIAILVFFHGWPVFGIMLMFVGFGDGAGLTLLNSYSTTIKSRSTRSVFNIIYIGNNLGVVIGTLLTGFLLDKGISLLFSVALIFYVILLLITIFEFNVKFDLTRKRNRKKAAQGPRRLNRTILLICLLVLSLYISYSLWESIISVHMTSLGISFEKYSLLWTLNGVMIVTLQPLVNRLGSHFKLSTQTYVGVIIFALATVGLIFARQYTAFIMAMVFTTIGEIIAFPGMPTWIDSLSAPEDRGRYQGMFNAFVSIGRALGPVIGGFVLQYSTDTVLFSFSGALIIFFLIILVIRNKKVANRAKLNTNN